ncbi:MAG: extracellular solute-binding protein [Oscillospiraceae bacterium]|nr:extracellular solute-binding protein [Oscillospiraceae bacterium]
MKMKKLLALLLTMAMVLSLAACGSKDETPSASGDEGEGGATAESTLPLGYDPETGTEAYGPYYDEWSDMTDEELYEMAKEEVANGADTINVYATSSKMLKVVDTWNELYPELKLEVSDLDSDEVLSKAEIECETNNITADVLQTKDVNGDVFFKYYSQGVIEPFYPRDICSHIDEENLKFSYPLYASQAFWYYNTAAFSEQPIQSWWQIIEKNDDGSQKYRLYAKEIGQETAYLSLFASFITNAAEMEQSYKDIYGEDLEYTYDASKFDFEVPENNAGVEYLWRFSQCKMTFIGDGDELVLAVHNSTAEEPALALASAGKITNRDESGYDIAWCVNLTPYTALLNTESMFAVKGCDNPAGARLFIRFVTGGADGKSGGLKPFSKEGNWMLRDDVEDDWNPEPLANLGARANDLDAIYSIYPDVQDMWTLWLNQNPNM